MVADNAKESLQCLDVGEALGKEMPWDKLNTSQTGTRTSDWPHGPKDAISPGPKALACGSRRLRAASNCFTSTHATGAEGEFALPSQAHGDHWPRLQYA